MMPSTVESTIRKGIATATQAKVATATGIDGTTLSRWLSGERSISIDQLNAVCDAVGLQLLSAHEVSAMRLLLRKALLNMAFNEDEERSAINLLLLSLLK